MKDLIKLILLILFALVVIAAALSLPTLVVMIVWNRVIASIFAIRTISFWEAFGIYALFAVLFGSVGGAASAGRSERD